jgi:ABC-type glutathione transport system ATPase component
VNCLERISGACNGALGGWFIMTIGDMNTGLIHLRELTLTTDGVDDGEYPFNVQTVKNISQLKFTSSVTIFVGENGSGKSTCLKD